MTGRRGCLGRLVLLVLSPGRSRRLARLLGWSDAATGSFFLLVLALLAVGGSGRGRASGTAPVTKVALAPIRGPGSPLDDRSDPPTGLVAPSTFSASTTHGSAATPIQRARDPLPARLRFGILQRDGFRCRYCGRTGSTPDVVLHVDHVVPVAAGGTTSEDNLLTACEECNLGKGVAGRAMSNAETQHARRSRRGRRPPSDGRTSSTRPGGSSAPYEGMTADGPSQPTRYSTVTDTLSVWW